jgi:pSer/pThr/pTyr-binding forkhead associated (FHA) protein
MACGFIAWGIMEPSSPGIGPRWDIWEASLMLLFGALLGAGVGGFDGWRRGSRLHLIRGLGLGVVFGLIGASLGHSLGTRIAQAVFGPIFVSTEAVALPLQIMARVVALTPIGALLGLAIGAAGLSPKKMIQGVIGGSIGAAIGAAVFDIVGFATAGAQLAAQGSSSGEVGAPSRAIFFTTIGGAIALFIGLIELATRHAYVRLVLGRNEGREWPVDGAETFIGRDERAQIPLFGDNNVASLHASIRKQGNRYTLIDGGSPIGIGVNGMRVAQHDLQPGDTIMVGSHQLQFMVKGHRTAYAPEAYPRGGMTPQFPAAGPPPGYGQPAMPQAMPTHQPTVAMPAQAPMAATVAMPAAGPSGFSLIALDGPLAGTRFAVGAGLELGRESAQIPMAYDSNASRRHAAVTSGIGGVTVRDLGSTNGTYLNSQRVQQADARPGDILRIGATSFRVEVG